MSREMVRVIYAAETSQGRIFLGFSDASFCTVSLEELMLAKVSNPIWMPSASR